MSEYLTKTTRKKKPLADRFAKHLAPPNENGCILWDGSTDRKGYGVINVRCPKQKTMFAHRVAYELAYGDFDKSLCVCHQCDVPACCNPAHLFLGTQGENVRDCVNKGRHSRQKLNEESVLKIRSQYAEGTSGYIVIGKSFGVCSSTVRRIVKRKIWKHI